MGIPTEGKIREFLNKLSLEVRDQLAPLAKKARQEYLRARRASDGDPAVLARVVANHAEEVFMTRVSPVLKWYADDPDSSRLLRHIARQGGEAETAYFYACKLVQEVEHGTEPTEWIELTELHLRRLIRDVEDLWHDPAALPAGWERFVLQTGPEVAVSFEFDLEEGKPPEKEGEASIPSEQGNREAQKHRAAVDALIERCLRENGVKVTRKMIWLVAGYKCRTEFERWESASDRATRSAARNIERVLAMSTDSFLAQLTARRLI